MRPNFYLQLWSRWLLLLAAGWCAFRPALLQGQVDVGIAVSPAIASLTQPLVYTITVTNTTAASLVDLLVTNVFPSSVTLVSSSSSSGIVTNVPNGVSAYTGYVVSPFSQLASGAVGTVTFTVQPTVAGLITDTVWAWAPTFALGASVSATNSLQVYSGVSDLAVGITGPADGILVNDSLNYRVGVTNLGPDAVTGTQVSVQIPDGLSFVGLTPPGQTYTWTNRFLTVTFDALSTNSPAVFQLNLAPTNAGSYAVTASVSAPGFNDPNSTNDVSLVELTASAPSTVPLLAALVSGQTFNPQTGLFEETVRLTNAGTNQVGGARLTVSGLTNTLVDAIGTNNGAPYVVYRGSLPPSSSVDLTLHYFIPAREPVADPIVSAVAFSPVPPAIPSGVPVTISQIQLLAGGRILLEFPSVPGTRYTVVYSAIPGDSNAIPVLPPIVASADRTQWIDEGPPGTSIHPASVPARFYQVIHNP